MRAATALCVFLLLTLAAHGQSGIGVEIDEVVDNRMSASDTGQFQMRGGLDLRVKLNGNGLDKALAARVIVKEAKDDTGKSLMEAEPSVPDFMPRDYNSGTLQMSVLQPERKASTVRLKGTVELYVPGRDPGASLKIDKALAKLDTPLSSKALKAAKIELTPLSRAGYEKAKESRKITDKDLEKVRAEGKARGIDEKEIALAIEMAKAFESMDGDYPEGSLVLSGKKADFDRIFRIEVLGKDGKPMNTSGRSTSTRGESALMTLNLSEPAPPDAVLEILMITDKARMSFPFDLKVELP
jgi:hypothetical protein